jgi:hypothetical protein
MICLNRFLEENTYGRMYLILLLSAKVNRDITPEHPKDNLVFLLWSLSLYINANDFLKWNISY